MSSARSADRDRPRARLGRRWRWRHDAREALERAAEELGIERRRRRGDGARPTGRGGGRRARDGTARPLERPGLERAARRRDGRGRGAAARGARPRDPAPRRARSTPGSARRGSSARLLIRMSWPAMATNAATLPIRSASSAARASRYAPASAPSGTVRTSSWRASISDSRSPSGPSKLSMRTWVATSARRPSPNMTVGAVGGVPDAARTDSTTVSSPRRRGGAARPRPARRARPGGGSARPSVASSRAARAIAADSSAWSRSRSSAGPKPGTPRASAHDPRAPGLAERPGDAGQSPTLGPLPQSWSRPASEERPRPGPAQHAGWRPRPARGAGRRRASRRTGRAAAGSARSPAPPAPRAGPGPRGAPGTGGP